MINARSPDAIRDRRRPGLHPGYGVVGGRG
jgi:hypothetical protein